MTALSVHKNEIQTEILKWVFVHCLPETTTISLRDLIYKIQNSQQYCFSLGQIEPSIGYREATNTLLNLEYKFNASEKKWVAPPKKPKGKKNANQVRTDKA